MRLSDCADWKELHCLCAGLALVIGCGPSTPVEVQCQNGCERAQRCDPSRFWSGWPRGVGECRASCASKLAAALDNAGLCRDQLAASFDCSAARACEVTDADACAAERSALRLCDPRSGPLAPLNRIVFARREAGRVSELYTIRPDGGGLTVLSAMEGVDASSPAFSTDRRRVAFVSSRALYSVDTVGHDLQEMKGVFTVVGDSVNPSWHRTDLSLTSENRAGHKLYEFETNYDGTNYRINGYDVSDDRTQFGWEPRGDAAVYGVAWSPVDRRAAVLVAFQGGGGSRLCIANGRWTELSRCDGYLAPPSTTLTAPRFSRDGKSIAFNEADTVKGTLRPMVMDTDTFSTRQITDGSFSNPSFSPDGRRLCAASAGVDGTLDLYLIDLSTEVATPLTRTPGIAESTPDWG